MNPAPRAFRRLFALHNRNALLMALGSLFGAALLWVAAGAFFLLILLGLFTSVQGDWGGTIPDWMLLTSGGLVAALFVWGSVDQWLRRFATPSDRAIIGWHVIKDALLLPVRITFAVWGNLSAILHYRRLEIDHAWQVLQLLNEHGRLPTNAVAQLDGDARQLNRSMIALQMLGLVDLHQGADGPFFLVRSEALDALQRAVLIENR